MQRFKKTAAIAVAACMLLAVLGASAAMAEVKPAKFSATNLKMTTTGVTLKKGAESKTCQLQGGTTNGSTSGSEYLFQNEMSLRTRFTCTGSTLLRMWLRGTAYYDTTAAAYGLNINGNFEPSQSPFPGGGGFYTQNNSKALWTNGSGATPSQVVFNEVVIGEQELVPLKMTGTFNVTTWAGGLVTLS